MTAFEQGALPEWPDEASDFFQDLSLKLKVWSGARRISAARHYVHLYIALQSGLNRLGMFNLFECTICQGIEIVRL